MARQGSKPQANGEKPAAAPPRAARQPPAWKQPRNLLIAGGGAALLGVLGAVYAMLYVGSAGDLRALTRRTDAFLERQAKESPATRHSDAERKRTELDALVSDPAFDRLPTVKQEVLRARLRELTAYAAYREQLDAIEDPRNVRTEEQLRKVRASLEALEAPVEYRPEWGQSEARLRHVGWLADAAALEKAVRHALDGYRDLARRGEEVLAKAQEANLPRRAQDVLDRAREYPDPRGASATLLPESKRLTYAVVFQFAGVAEALQRWQKVRERLEPLAVPKTP